MSLPLCLWATLTLLYLIFGVAAASNQSLRLPAPAVPYPLTWPGVEINSRLGAINYQIPHTDTILGLRFGPLLQPRAISVVLMVVQDILTDQVVRHGADARLPGGEFDYVTQEKVEFSAYSPRQLPQERQLTWHVLKNVVDGLVDLLVLQNINREVGFRINDGPERVFVGYGHLVHRRA